MLYKLHVFIMHSIIKKTTSILFILILLLSSCDNKASENEAEIIWDTWGVPHIYANTEADMYYAFGWAQMQNHADLILELYAEARGSASEYFGGEYIERDRLARLFNLQDSAAAQYNRFTETDREHLDAFTKGLNDYANANMGSIADRVRAVLPVTAIDVMAHSKRVMNLEFLGGGDIRRSLHELKSEAEDITPGSNSYAIAPSKSESGNAMLVANPHLPWSDFYLFFEAHLNASDFNVYGTTLVGMPVLNIAFNEYLGWTHTVNTIDASDIYELTLQDGGYLLDGETMMFTKKDITMKILQDDHSVKDSVIQLMYSRHGPIVGEHENKALAVRIAGFEKDSYYSQYHKMGKAKNMSEFEEALQMMQIPMFNLIYADRDGNIMYFFNGNVPQRLEGNWSFWNSIVDGTRTDLIWDTYHEIDNLPRVINPESGFVQNANDAPWTSTYPIDLDFEDFPAYMSPKPNEFPTSLRAQRAINLIKDDNSISFEELVDYKLDTGMEASDRFLDELLKAIETEVSQPINSLGSDSVFYSKANEAADVLKAWDGSTDADSRGSVLFARWFDKIKSDMFSVPWNADDPVSTPSGLKNPKEAVDLLVEAANEVTEMYGAIDIPWGEVNRFRVDGIEFPGNGGHSKYGIFRTMYFQLNEKNNIGYAYHGDTYVAVVEFGDTIRAEVLLSYGNATQAGSMFVGDQLEMLSENKLRTAFLTREEIIQNAVEREVLDTP